jgi:acetyl esterase/lipase
MKYVTLFLSFNAIWITNSFAQQRYVDKVFNQVQVTTNVTYGQNFSLITGAPAMQNLIMDVYEPGGDSLTARPLIVYMHPGDFIPIFFNGEPTGDLHDSAVVEMCKQFALRGYVVADIDYRQGWNPLAAGTNGLAIRTGTLMQALYRGLQDAKTCVRYFRMNVAMQGNTYKIDVNRMVVGGQGSAGYIATAYATLNNPAELQLPKFISDFDAPIYGIFAGQSYINQAEMGDFDGLVGNPLLNNPNWPGYSSDVNMVFNMEGDLGDSTWIEAGEVPMVALHDVNNPLSPFLSDSAFFPFTIAVAGSNDFIRYANTLGNNNVFHVTWTDPYSLRADNVNGGGPWEYEGLFPIVQPDPSLVIPGNPYHGQVSPWEWWDSSDLVLIAQNPAIADTLYHRGLLTNPDMSKNKAMSYIDTAQYYLSERICRALGLCLGVGIDEVNLFKDQVHVFPNPVTRVAHLNLADASSHILAIKIYDAEGRKVFGAENLNQNSSDIACDQFGKGFFTIQAQTEKGIAIGKLVIE